MFCFFSNFLRFSNFNHHMVFHNTISHSAPDFLNAHTDNQPHSTNTRHLEAHFKWRLDFSLSFSFVVVKQNSFLQILVLTCYWKTNNLDQVSNALKYIPWLLKFGNSKLSLYFKKKSIILVVTPKNRENGQTQIRLNIQ